MNVVVYNLIMDEAFRFSSPGYKDWDKFKTKPRFKRGLLDYIQPTDYQKLLNNNVVVDDLLYDMLGKIQGFEQEVV